MGVPPIGYIRLASGEWAIDPDEQVQATVRLIFDQFDREATVHGLLRYLVHNGVRIPVRSKRGPNRGEHTGRALNPTIKVADLAWLEFVKPDLKRAETFARDFGFIVDANKPDAGQDELRLMATCRHHVIANSSLSWWAAWLATSGGQIVVAPTPWFTHRSQTPDLLPAAWIVMPRD